MSGWIGLPVTNQTDVLSVEFVNQFILAYAERRYAAHGGSLGGMGGWVEKVDAADWHGQPHRPPPSDELLLVFRDDPDAMDWRSLQRDVQGLAGSSFSTSEFLDQTLHPGGYDGEPRHGGFGGGTPPFVVFTPETWRTAAGIPAEGFTRKFPLAIFEAYEGFFEQVFVGHRTEDGAATAGQRAYLREDGRFQNGELDYVGENYPQPWLTGRTVYEYDGAAWVKAEDQAIGPDLVVGHGFTEPGDYMGPWIFDELYRGLDVLRWTDGDPFRLGLEDGEVDYHAGGSEGGPSGNAWGDVLQDAIDDYRERVAPSSISPRNYGYAHRRGGGDLNYVAQVVGVQMSYELTGVGRDLDYEIDMLAVWQAPALLSTDPDTNDPYRVFDGANVGVDGSYEDKWKLMQTMPVAAETASVTTAEFGSTTMPPAPDNPDGHSGPGNINGDNNIGAVMGSSHYVLRWKFEYVN